jgi:hypothetical protein
MGLFSGREKADHPLADLKEAKRLLGALPVADPHQAVSEISDWINSIEHVEGFKFDERFNLIMLLEDTGQVHARKLMREYLNNPRMPKQQESKLWSACHEFWKQLGGAYLQLTDASSEGAKGSEALKNLLPLLGVRTLRALAAELKWLQMRYGPVHGDLWFACGRTYRYMRAKKLQQKMVLVSTSMPGESSAEQEFLKLMMFAASSPDSMVPVEIEITERIIAHFLPHFHMTDVPQPDTTYWLDLDEADPPTRLAQPPDLTDTLVFFSAGTAIQGVEELSGSIGRSKVLPSGLSMGGDYKPELVTEVLDHLAMYWAKTPPIRRHERHRVKARLSVVHGYVGLSACLAWDGSTTDLAVQGGNTIESWVVQNVSAGGFGAVTPQVTGDWLQIGSLVGLQPSGGDNWLVGIVRRLSRETTEQGNVGIQTIAKSAQSVELKNGGSGSAMGTGVLLVDPSDKAGEVRVLLERDRFDARRSIEMVRDGAGHLLMPIEVIEAGADYELARYRDMRRAG